MNQICSLLNKATQRGKQAIFNPQMYKNRQHPTEAECRLFCCPILPSSCRFCSFLKLLSYRHTAKPPFLPRIYGALFFKFFDYIHYYRYLAFAKPIRSECDLILHSKQVIQGHIKHACNPQEYSITRHTRRVFIG